MFANFPEADCFIYAFVREIRATPSVIDARACASCALRDAEFPPPAAAICATAESPRKMSAPPSSASSLSTSTISEDTYLYVGKMAAHSPSNNITESLAVSRLPLKIFIARQTTRTHAELQQFFMFRPISFFLFEAKKTLLRKCRPRVQSPPHLSPRLYRPEFKKQPNVSRKKSAQPAKAITPKREGKKKHPKKKKKEKRNAEIAETKNPAKLAGFSAGVFILN